MWHRPLAEDKYEERDWSILYNKRDAWERRTSFMAEQIEKLVVIQNLALENIFRKDVAAGNRTVDNTMSWF